MCGRGLQDFGCGLWAVGCVSERRSKNSINSLTHNQSVSQSVRRGSLSSSFFLAATNQPTQQRINTTTQQQINESMNNTTTQHDATHKEEEVQKQCKQPTTKPQNHKDNDGGGDDVGRRRHNTLKMPPQLDLRAITMQLGTKWVVAYNRRQVPLQHNAVHTTPGATHIEKTKDTRSNS